MKSLLRKLLLLLVLLANGQVGFAAGKADELRPVSEYAMKMVYLYNFALLAEWPTVNDVAEAPFNLCIYGQDEIASSFDGLRGKTVNMRALRMLRVYDATEARNCHLLFVGEGAGERGARLLEALRGAPVLTVTDDPRLTRSGVMLQIVPDDRRLAFEVNLDVVRRSQLKLSSKLLRLAKRISGE
jgi:hypothetical protein